MGTLTIGIVTSSLIRMLGIMITLIVMWLMSTDGREILYVSTPYTRVVSPEIRFIMPSGEAEAIPILLTPYTPYTMGILE